MAEVNTDSDFCSYKFSDEELVSAATLNVLQKMYFSSKRAEIASDMVRLKLDPLNVNKYLQEQAYLTGQLELLDFILNHEEAEAARQRWSELVALKEKQRPQASPAQISQE